MNSIRELIILEFIARGAVVRSTGSPQAYSTDVGANVLRCQKDVGDNELPCMSVWPQDETADAAHGKTRCKMIINVDGIAFFGSSAASVIGEQIRADLVKCFASPAWDRRRIVAGSPVTYLGPYAESIIYQSGGVDTPLAGAVTVGASVSFLVTYSHAVGDPYTL